VEDGYDLAAIIAGLKAKGMRVEHALPAVGVVVGTVSPERVAAIETLPGVKVVTASGTIDLNRPDGRSNATTA
jgi:hypothetical protein